MTCACQITFCVLLLVVSAAQAEVLTSAQKTAILDKHNTLRAGVSSPCTATDMETMVWDDTLASDSLAYAEGCVGDHASGAGSQFGENIWASFGSGGATYATSDITGGIQEWYNEIADVDWIKDANGEYIEAKSKSYSNVQTCQAPDAANGNCFIGHFTQVVWAKSNKVGCGIKTCSSLTVSSQSMGAGVLLICRYTPAGNSAAAGNAANHLKMPYIAGTACAGCSGSCSTAGLCNAGTTPTRCYDVVPTNYNSCADMKTQVTAQMTGAGLSVNNICTDSATAAFFSGVCELTCGTCSVPSGVGVSHCGAGSSGGSSGGSSSGTSGGSTSGGSSGGTSGGTSGGSSGSSGGSNATTAPKGSVNGAGLACRLWPALLFVSFAAFQLA